MLDAGSSAAHARTFLDALFAASGARPTAVVYTHGGSPRDYFGENKVPGAVLPLYCLPTTAGTGSEVSAAAVVTDTDIQLKISTLSNHLRPRLGRGRAAHDPAAEVEAVFEIA